MSGFFKSYQPKIGEVVRGVGRSGKTYVGAYRRSSPLNAFDSVLTLEGRAGRVYVRTDSLEPINPDEPIDCELCGEPVDDETGEFWDGIQERGVVAHAQCGEDAGFRLA